MQNIGKNTQKHTSGGVIILMLLACMFLGAARTADAQGVPTPTPLPQVVATRQAADNAAQQVNSLQAERAQTQARLDEINRNIEAQIADAERAAADARNAAATQNAVEAGAAIGRLEGAIAQLRASYAGKDTIISDMAARLDLQAAQSISSTQMIDRLTLELQQARNDKQNAVKAYNALTAQKKSDSDNEMALNAVYLLAALAFLLAMITLAAFVIQRRRDVPDAPAAPPADVIDGGYTIGDNAP